MVELGWTCRLGAGRGGLGEDARVWPMTDSPHTFTSLLTVSRSDSEPASASDAASVDDSDMGDPSLVGSAPVYFDAAEFEAPDGDEEVVECNWGIPTEDEYERFVLAPITR